MCVLRRICLKSNNQLNWLLSHKKFNKCKLKKCEKQREEDKKIKSIKIRIKKIDSTTDYIDFKVYLASEQWLFVKENAKKSEKMVQKFQSPVRVYKFPFELVMMVNKTFLFLLDAEGRELHHFSIIGFVWFLFGCAIWVMCKRLFCFQFVFSCNAYLQLRKQHDDEYK